ncbi:MAG: hypothetical protein JNK49_18830 [Planctomycetes bacterium]|nr:hypothetical protein [Planctomycetota bacterium]
MTTLRFLFAVWCSVAGAVAQWPGVPTQNQPIGDAVGNQAVPRVAATPDGGCYIGWFDNRGGNYDLRLQRLAGSGQEQWPHGGLVVSSNPQNGSLVGWDLLADRDGHCVLVFTDVRQGPDLDVYAYRVAPSGAFVWGNQGVAVSANGDAEGNPTVVEAADGDFVVFWPNSTQRTIQMQRLDRAGAPRFPGDGIATPGDTGQTPAFVRAVPGLGGAVLAVWVRTLAITGTKHLHAMAWDAVGTPLWNGGTRLPVFDLASLPIAHEPRLVADGAGGCVVAWHYAQGQQFFARVQRLSAAGVEVFPHNGVDLSTNANSRFDPSVVFLPSSQTVLAVFNERNQAQSSWGISAQAVDAAGNRLLGSSGVTVIPVSGVEVQAPQAVPTPGGLLAVVNERLPAPNTYQVTGMRVLASGAAAVTPVATAPSQKIRTVAAGTASGTLFAAWSDTRTDSGDVYAQNLNADLSLGDRWATTQLLGCGGNPAGSLVVTGRAAIGTAVHFGVDNPLATQAVGSLAALVVGFAPQSPPCGMPMPGYGMAGPGAPGELLVDPALAGLVLIGGPWLGPQQPVDFVLQVPAQAGFYGLALFAQGVVLDPTPAAAVPVGLTIGARATIGS